MSICSPVEESCGFPTIPFDITSTLPLLFILTTGFLVTTPPSIGCILISNNRLLLTSEAFTFVPLLVKSNSKLSFPKSFIGIFLSLSGASSFTTLEVIILPLYDNVIDFCLFCFPFSSNSPLFCVVSCFPCSPD